MATIFRAEESLSCEERRIVEPLLDRSSPMQRKTARNDVGFGADGHPIRSFGEIDKKPHK